MYATPLLLVGFAQLVNFLILAAQALVVAKKLELGKQQSKGMGRGSGSGSGPGGSGSIDTDVIKGGSYDAGDSATASTGGGVLRRSKRGGT
jgi:hypothetical protein